MKLRSRVLLALAMVASFVLSFCVRLDTSDSAGLGKLTVSQAQAMVGPYERNRVWRVVNNGCRTPDGMFPPATEFEINMCLTVHRGTGYADRRQALLNLRRIGAVRFHDYQVDLLVRATERARPGYFERVVRMVAAPTRLGRFILELCEDHERIRLILTSQPVPLE